MASRLPPVPLPLLVLLLLAAACEIDTADGPTPRASDTPSPAVSTATAPALSSPAPPGLTRALVVGVVDGDTIDVLIDGQEHRVRYIGVDTPETVAPSRPEGCFGREASARNRELVEGKTVALERDVSETDRYGRLLRYVWLDSRMVNATLVEEGYATAGTYPPDVAYAETFASLQASAREAQRGLWGPACASPPPSPPAAGACEYSDSDKPVIKGNISYTTGEKIYHVPGGYYYDDTVINESAGERWFCTEAEAVAAGWRKSKR